MDKPPSPMVVIVSLALLVAGWVVIFLGWLGAGRQEITTGQLPYVISGGFGGAGLLLLGVAGLLLFVVQRSSWRRRQDTLELLEAVRGLAERLEQVSSAGSEPDADDDLAPRRKKRKAPAARRKRTRAAT